MSECPIFYMSDHLRVGILGATGAVGQTFVRLLADHPHFEIAALAASERSAGQSYREAANWISGDPIPEAVASMTVVEATPPLDVDLVFSGLDSVAAATIEPAFARAGIPVVSNAKSFRMQPDVPLLIPEVNPDHVALVRRQDWGEEGAFIVTNPNCAAVGLVVALKPLADAFGVEAAHVVTMQALSGAGYPGVSSLDILGNVVPFIPGEEEKVSPESRKVLGELRDGAIRDYPITISAQCNRVPVLNGHLECVSVKLNTPASPEDVREAFATWRSPISELGLPSAPEKSLQVMDDPFYPQPRRHAGLGNGMSVSVGRVQPCPVLDIRFVVLSHNTIRGAAGGAVLNAELLQKKGLLKTRSPVAV